MNPWPSTLQSTHLYLVGIKGTGMAALAELLVQHGAMVSGSDVADVFFTDAMLAALDIPVFQGFDAGNVPEDAALVIHSAAYDPARHPELLRAKALGLPVMEYTAALGAFSASTDSSGVAGVHGKTSTTAMAGTVAKALALPGSALVGSGVANFDGRATWCAGDEFFIAETCEYRRHFLHFHPRRIILTSVEPDHLDYFKDYDDIAEAFVEYATRLPEGGSLIYCADDEGAVDVATRVGQRRSDIACIPYGFHAQGDFAISGFEQSDGLQSFQLAGFRHPDGGLVRFELKVPGRHNVLNASAALALVTGIYADRFGTISPAIVNSMAAGLKSFRGTKRRSEILGEARGVLFMDDYAHHPTAITTTLQGYRDFFPTRRLVVAFMSHTWSRTKALLDEFAVSFGPAHKVLLHEIYASARETDPGDISGEILYQRTCQHHADVHFIGEPMDSLDWLEATLQSGDLFVTMGAGDNWKVGATLYARWSGTTTLMEDMARLRERKGGK